ncbi:MAG TPA: methyltransferase domain-containing protein [Acidimicrobiales bacterium]
MTTKISLITSRLPPDTNQFEELLAWIVDSTNAPRRVLDVGGGGSFYDFGGRLRPHAQWMSGVDPDPTVLDRPWLDEAHAATVEEYARARSSGAEAFDAAVCLYVVEHVEQPLAFLTAIRSLLKTGGACFGVTPNLWHYFGMISAAATRAGVEDWLLHRVRSSELIEAYHSPVRYRMNTIRSLSRTAEAAGFRAAEVRGLDQPGMFETYFPEPLRAFPRLYSRAINRVGSPHLCGSLIFRLDT